MITIGADPELFVRDKDRFITAYGLIPGDKRKPHKVKGGAVQVDGMALEFNIPPAISSGKFITSINKVLFELRKMVPQDLDMVISPIASFDKDYMEKLPRAATLLGCLPDYNAYTGDTNPAPCENTRLRTAAGHIHIGWTKEQDPMSKEHFDKCRMIVKSLDYRLGIPSLLLDTDTGAEVRRSMYGKAGCFRPKPYGLEYRVLSNFWLKNNAFMKWVYTATLGTMNQTSFDYEKNVRDKFGTDAEDIINNNKTNLASKVTSYLGIKMPNHPQEEEYEGDYLDDDMEDF